MGGQSGKGGMDPQVMQQVDPAALDELRSQFQGGPEPSPVEGRGMQMRGTGPSVDPGMSIGQPYSREMERGIPRMTGGLNPETGINDRSTSRNWQQAGQLAGQMFAPRMMAAGRQMQGGMRMPQPQGQMPGQRPGIPQSRFGQQGGGGPNEAIMQMIKAAMGGG